MLVPLSWLKEYVDIDVTPEELEKKLFDGGFEVEERYQVGKDISNVVVGLVERADPGDPSSCVPGKCRRTRHHADLLRCRQRAHRRKIPGCPSWRFCLCNSKRS